MSNISHDKIYSDFGKRLASLRQEIGLSQSELATRLNMPQSTYAGYETGKRKINLELIEQFSSFFKISPTLLITGKQIMPYSKVDNYSSHEQNIIKKYRALDERGKQVIEDNLEREYEFVMSKLTKESD